MNRFLPLMILFYFALPYGVLGQCSFTAPDRYGLICEQAVFLCGSEMQDYEGRLPEVDSPSPQPNSICNGNGSFDNVLWFSFVPNDTNLEINIIYDNCIEGDPQLGIGFQAGMFSTCEVDGDQDPIGTLDCTEDFGISTLTLKPDPTMVVPGELYYIYVDGIGRAVCDFEFDIISGVCTDTISAPDECPQDCGVSNQFDDNLACTGISETYSFTPSGVFFGSGGCSGFNDLIGLDSILCIDWQITPDAPASNFDILSVTNYFDSLNITSEITINWNTPGEYTVVPVVNFNPLFSGCQSGCLCTGDVAYKVTVSETINIVLPVVELCPGDCHTFCGESYCSSTTETCEDRASCTFTTQEIIVKDIKFVDIGDYYICEGNCFIFDGMSYCTPSQFSVPDPFICDTSYVFELFDLELDLAFDQADLLIDCNNNDAIIIVDITTNYPDALKTYWLNGAGDTVSLTNEYIAFDEGTYTFYALPLSVEGCITSISHTVDIDVKIPDVELIPPSLDCSTLLDSILFNTADAIASVTWNGPSGFTSTDQSPTVSESGEYTVIITGMNGCATTLMAVVDADFVAPVILLESDNFTCTDVLPIAQYTADQNIISTEWLLPDNSTSSEEMLSLVDTGSYSLTVTADNGCTDQETFLVTDLSYDPALGLNEDYIWRCNDSMRIVDISSLISPDLKYTWNTIEGGFISDEKILVINEPGIFVLISEDQLLGCIGLDTVNISIDDNPFLDVIYKTHQPTCRDESDGSIEIMSLIGGQEPYVYNYNGASYSDVSNIEFDVGVHTMAIVDFYGCEISKTFEIINPDFFEIITDPLVTISHGLSGKLVAEVSIADELLDNITWSDMEGNILADGLEVELDGMVENIMVAAEDINGCLATAMIRVVIDYEVDIHHPSIFSPNNDGNNDYFMLWNAGFPEVMDEFIIYDRSGGLMFRETNIPFNQTDNGWNGRFNNQELQPGVFIFLIKYTLGNGEQKIKSGSITLVK